MWPLWCETDAFWSLHFLSVGVDGFLKTTWCKVVSSHWQTWLARLTYLLICKVTDCNTRIPVMGCTTHQAIVQYLSDNAIKKAKNSTNTLKRSSWLTCCCCHACKCHVDVTAAIMCCSLVLFQHVMDLSGFVTSCMWRGPVRDTRLQHTGWSLLAF